MSDTSRSEEPRVMYANTTKADLEAMELFEESSAVLIDGTCPICFVDYNHTEDPEETPAEWPIRLPCSHIIGSACGKTWLSRSTKSCPLCRAEMFTDPIRKATVTTLKARLVAFEAIWMMDLLPKDSATTELRARLWAYVKKQESSPGYVEPSEEEKESARVCAMLEFRQFASGPLFILMPPRPYDMETPEEASRRLANSTYYADLARLSLEFPN